MNYQTISAKKITLIEPWMMEIVQELYGYNLQMSEISRIFAEEFNMPVTQADVQRYFEPTLQEEVQDLELVYARI